MTIVKPTTQQPYGFTLIEMTVVLIIFGLLLTMFLTPISTQRNIQLRAKTEKQLFEIKEALLGYTVIHGQLPCPDTNTPPTGLADASCANSTYGVLPWATLGLDNADAWGHYFSYYTDSTFSKPFGISNSSNGDISVEGESGSLASTASHLAAIVVSHGANGLGAYNTNNTKAPDPSNLDELENTNDGDGEFVSHPPTADGFDDQLIWISPKVLINRMITAERLP